MDLKSEVIAALKECDLVENISNDYFTYYFYADYDDWISDGEIEKILESYDPEQTLWEYLFWNYDDAESYALHDIFDEAKETLDDDDIWDEEDEENVKEIIRDRVEFIYPIEHYLEQKICVDITLDTGDWNYEFGINQIAPAWDGEDWDTEIPKESAIRWLAETQGYSEKEMRDAFKGYEKNGVPEHGFLPSMYVELENVVTHCNAVVILAEMTLEEAIELNRRMKKALFDKDGNEIYYPEQRPDCGKITISKDAMIGLYDSWNGGGSVFEIELEKDFDLPIRNICEARIDVNHLGNYSIEECYGMCRSAWKDVVSGICA